MCKSTKYKKYLIVLELLSIYQKAEKSTTFLPNEMESIKKCIDFFKELVSKICRPATSNSDHNDV